MWRSVSGGRGAIGTGSSSTGNNHGNGQGYNEAIHHFYEASGLQPLFSHIQLTLSATKLLDRDILSKSYPMAVVYMKKRDDTLQELGRTEVVMNSLSPSWIEKIPVIYNFEIIQPLVFHVYNIDKKFHNIPVKALQLSEQDLLGVASCFMSELVTKNESDPWTVKLENKNRKGDLSGLAMMTVHTEESAESKTTVEIVFHCTNLKNKDFFPKSDPFLKISRLAESKGTIPICQTEVILNNSAPTWKPVRLTMQQIVSKDNPLIIECFHFNSSGNHQRIGTVTKSTSDLENLYNENVGVNFVVSHRGHNKVSKGELFVGMYGEKQSHSFLDYLSSGYQLNFMVAVDFTSSNGHPTLQHSLHYIDPSGSLNAYQRAIVEVCEILQFYDSDKRYPAWGFGGKIRDGEVSYCFNLDLAPNDSEVVGVEGIMAAYASSLSKISLSGPTLVAKVISKASEIAAQSVSSDTYKYSVLLLITDGQINDLQATTDALVKASELPLSVLIVGVGKANFNQMEVLNTNDDGSLLKSSTGDVATRHIVQFMPMRDVEAGQISSTQILLQKLPGQFLAYMTSRNLKPRTSNPEPQTS